MLLFLHIFLCYFNTRGRLTTLLAPNGSFLLSFQLPLIMCSPLLLSLPWYPVTNSMSKVFEGSHPRLKFQFLFQLPMLKTAAVGLLAVLWSRLSSAGWLISWFNLRSLYTGSSISCSPRAKQSHPRRPGPHCTRASGQVPLVLFHAASCGEQDFSIAVAMFQESNHPCRIAHQASDSIVFAAAYWLKKITKPRICM